MRCRDTAGVPRRQHGTTGRYIRWIPGGAAWILCAALLGSLHACGPDSPVDPTADLVVFGARVWDGTGAALTEPSVLQVAGGRILSVTPLDESTDMAAAAAEAGVTAVDATGQYIVPGLINTHGHVGGTWNGGMAVDYADYATAELERYARFGVTSVNSLGGDREPSFALRDASWGDASPAHARLLVAGPVVTGSTPEEAAAATEAAAAMGPDWIKIRVDDNLGTTSKMSPDGYAAVISRAGEHGLPVASHLFYHEDAKGLLRAGTGMVAHSIRDEAVDDETIGLFRETGVCYVPTLTREVSTFRLR